MKLPTALLTLVVLFPAAPARAGCHWAWHCEQSGNCGFVPYCDSPHDTPPPLQGAWLGQPAGARPLPPPDSQQQRRKPLPGYKPVNPPPAAAPVGPPAPADEAGKKTPAPGSGPSPKLGMS